MDADKQNYLLSIIIAISLIFLVIIYNLFNGESFTVVSSLNFWKPSVRRWNMYRKYLYPHSGRPIDTTLYGYTNRFQGGRDILTGKLIV